MASLKQTKIYGALEVYNGENKVNITVDPENYPNGIMNVGCISIDDIEMYKTGDDSLAITYPIVTEHVNATTIETSSISNIHSIEFDGITGSKISNLYDLTLNSAGVINFGSGSNKISSEASSAGGNYFKLLLNHPAIGGIRIGYNKYGQEDYASIAYNGTNLNIDKPLTIDTGLSLNKTSISNLGTLSFGSSDTTATLLWDGTSIKFDKDIVLSNGKLLMCSGNDSHIKYLSSSGEWAITSYYSNSVLSFKRGSDSDDKKVKLDWDGSELSIDRPLKLGDLQLKTSTPKILGKVNHIKIGSFQSEDASEIGTTNYRYNYDGTNTETTNDGLISIGYNIRSIVPQALDGAGTTTTAGVNDGIIIGNRATGQASAIVIGADANITKPYAGYIAPTTKLNPILIGKNAQGYLENSIAIGYNAKANVIGGIALGPGANATSKSLYLPTGYTATIQGTGNNSDRNDKIDIHPLSGKYLDIIKKLEPVTYRFNYRDFYAVENPDPKYLDIYGQVEYDKNEHKRQSKAGTRTHVGFIAQDVKKVLEETFPGEDKLDIVSIEKFTNENFKTDATDDEYKKYTINYSTFIPILVKAMQEQQEEIEMLKNEIEKLKNK